MPTAKLFNQYPPFPHDVPVVSLPIISLARLVSEDRSESESLFHACKTTGFIKLDLQGIAEGEALLARAENLFEISYEVSSLSLEEKMKYAVEPPDDLYGYHFSSVFVARRDS